MLNSRRSTVCNTVAREVNPRNVYPRVTETARTDSPVSLSSSTPWILENERMKIIRMIGESGSSSVPPLLFSTGTHSRVHRVHGSALINTSHTAHHILATTTTNTPAPTLTLGLPERMVLGYAVDYFYSLVWLTLLFIPNMHILNIYIYIYNTVTFTWANKLIIIPFGGQRERLDGVSFFPIHCLGRSRFHLRLLRLFIVKCVQTMSLCVCMYARVCAFDALARPPTSFVCLSIFSSTFFPPFYRMWPNDGR